MVAINFLAAQGAPGRLDVLISFASVCLTVDHTFAVLAYVMTQGSGDLVISTLFLFLFDTKSG